MDPSSLMRAGYKAVKFLPMLLSLLSLLFILHSPDCLRVLVSRPARSQDPGRPLWCDVPLAQKGTEHPNVPGRRINSEMWLSYICVMS